MYLEIGSEYSPTLLENLSYTDIMNTFSNNISQPYLRCILNESGNIRSVIELIRNHMRGEVPDSLVHQVNGLIGNLRLSLILSACLDSKVSLKTMMSL